VYCNEISFPTASFHMSNNQCCIFILCPQLYSAVRNVTSSVHSLMYFTCAIGLFKFQACWHPFQPLSSNKITNVSAMKPAHACAYVLKYAHIPHTHTHTHTCMHTYRYIFSYVQTPSKYLCIETGHYLWKYFTS
jgi:hypothetical protein